MFSYSSINLKLLFSISDFDICFFFEYILRPIIFLANVSFSEAFSKFVIANLFKIPSLIFYSCGIFFSSSEFEVYSDSSENSIKWSLLTFSATSTDDSISSISLSLLSSVSSKSITRSF